MNYYIPQWEERTSYGFRRIDPYAKLFEDRIIFLGTPISDDVANAVMAQLLCLESMNPDQDISIYINSARRLVHGAHGHLRHDEVHQGRRADRVPRPGRLGGGRAAGGRGPGKRLALPNSRILIHQPYTEGTFGQTSDIEIQANEILRMRELLEKMISDHSGKDVETVSHDIERDKILTAEQAVEYGLDRRRARVPQGPARARLSSRATPMTTYPRASVPCPAPQRGVARGTVKGFAPAAPRFPSVQSHAVQLVRRSIP